MCTALFAFGVHPNLLFFLAFNRDEFFSRPTEQAHWWKDGDVLGGRDGLRKGTWLAFNRSGRFAFLTNFREVKYNDAASGPSRGALPVLYLQSDASPMAFLKGLDLRDQNGLNLVVGDLKAGSVAYVTNRDRHKPEPRELHPGLYGLSNGVLDSSWPKVELGRSMLKDHILSQEGLSRESFPWDTVFDSVLLQCEKVEDPDRLPKTGLGNEVEKELSSIMIRPHNRLGDGGSYGTRSQTVIAGWNDGVIEFRERTVPEGRESRPEDTVAFELPVEFGEILKQPSCTS